MFKRTVIATSVALAITALPAVAQEEEGSFLDEWEIAGELKNESAVFTESGQGIGATTTSTQTTDTHGKDVYKSESSARIFINGDVGEEGSSFHAELNLRNDGEAISGYKGSKSYTQHDILRELYIDTEVGDEENPIAIRAGKQQVVWGTADGMKLLDVLNPTDWREFAQNTMEDSRIPVWMVNTEGDLESGGNAQLILSQSEANRIPGMSIASSTAASSHSNGDQGHPFMMKGVDTITGSVNGMLNVVPAMGSVATAFQLNGNTSGMTMAHVNDFATGTNAGETNQAAGFGAICTGGATDVDCLEAMVNDATNQVGGSAAGNANAQNLFSDTTAAQWTAGKANPTQVFHYMPEATFATFDQFVGLTSKYVVDHNDDPVIAARYKDVTEGGLNYSFNILHGNDSNPYVETHWENGDTGAVLEETASASAGGVYTTNNLGNGTTVGGSAAGTTAAVYVMEEKLNKITQLGSSFDAAIETASMGPMIIRGEFLYQKDVMSPIVTRKASTGVDLNHGFLVNALKMTKGDRFKYVLGADITVLTNMMVSAQFIQDRNLDFVDVGNKDATDWKYTADMATMHLTNNLNKGEENKEFYSFFMSKPFGNEQQHRWNNIFMYEENGGKWNRLDVEYSFNDEIIGTAEYNKYWGDANTQFGQMEKSSNFQLGLKYIF